jgi:hypothetical protein
MYGAVPLLLFSYAFMAWTRTVLLFLEVRSCILYFLLAADRQGGKLERCGQVQGFCCDSALRCVLFFPPIIFSRRKCFKRMF